MRTPPSRPRRCRPSSTRCSRPASRTSSPSAATTRRSRRGRSASARRARSERPRAQDDRQRPAAAAARPHLRLRDRAARRRRAGAQPDRGRQATRRWYVVVAMGRKAGHLALGIGKAAGATLSIIAEEFPDETVLVRPHLRHHRGRDHQAPGDGPHVRRRRPRRRADRQARSEGAGRPVRRRARRPRPRPLRRDRLRAQDQGGGRGPAHRARPQRHHHPQERRLRAALRRPDPVRRRVLPRPRLQRDPLPGRRRQRRHGQHPGRPAGADSRSTTCASRPPARPRSASSTRPARASGWRAPT